MVDVVVVTVLIITSVAVTAVNLFCLIVFALCPELKKASFILVANLLTTHLLQGIFVIPSYTAKRWNVGTYYQKGVICDTFRFSYMLTNYGSCLSLLTVTIDRLIAAYRPFKYKQIITTRTVKIGLTILWLYVIILCLLPFIPHGKPGKCSYVPHKTWSASMLIVNTFLPFIIIGVSYLLILRKIALSKSRTFCNEIRIQSDTQDAEERARELAVAKTSLIVITAYLFCWGPSFIYYLLSSLCSSCFPDSYKDSEAEEILTFSMKLITFFDGIIGPGIYCFKHWRFTSALQNLSNRIRST